MPCFEKDSKWRWPHGEGQPLGPAKKKDFPNNPAPTLYTDEDAFLTRKKRKKGIMGLAQRERDLGVLSLSEKGGGL